MKQHPREELLRYLDGELPARHANRVRKHLESCWQCRSELAELENAVVACVRHKESVLQPDAAPAPRPWMDIYRGFAEMDARATAPFWVPFVSPRAWAVAAAAVLAAVVLVHRFRETPAVEAAELLRKATAAEATQEAKPRRLEIRTAKRRLLRTVGTAQPAASRPDREGLDSLQAMFVAAHYDWNDPLSAKAYQAWHDQLAGKRDSVSQESGAYTISTSTGASELTNARIKLNANDLRPLEERFEFRNREWVEISELEPEPAPVTAAPAPAMAELTKPPENIPAPVTAAASLTDELQVLAALHRIGADLGDPVEVSRSGGDVLVTGVGIPERRQTEIRDALSSEPHVAVRFSDPVTPPDMPPGSPSSDSTTNADILQIQAGIAARAGGRAQFEELAGQALDLSEEMMSRAYAVHRLALRFAPEVEARMDPNERRVLNAILQDHTAALRRQSSQLAQILKPVLPGGGGSTPAAPTTVWQPASTQLLTAARQTEKLLAAMAGSSGERVSNRDLLSQLQANLNSVRSLLAIFDRRNE